MKVVADPGRRARLQLGGGGGGGVEFSLDAPINSKSTIIIWVRHLQTEIR